MHQHIKKLWVDALRSGKYQQGTGHLRHEGNYCCLGVLCDLYDRNQNGPGWDEDAETYLCNDAFLPRRVAEWAGVIGGDESVAVSRDEFNVAIPEDGHRCYLTCLNDSGSSFGEIADLIEQQL